LNDPIKPALACVLTTLLASCASQPPLPIAPGVYRFQQRFAEQPSMQGMDLKATIDGHRIELVNDGAAGIFPRGLIEQGLLLWHARSQQWIIVSDPADAVAGGVGGCTDGPAVVDLVARIYWTC
jgi:hypothetical protein